jgi:hypothetical protein
MAQTPRAVVVDVNEISVALLIVAANARAGCISGARTSGKVVDLQMNRARHGVGRCLHHLCLSASTAEWKRLLKIYFCTENNLHLAVFGGDGSVAWR